MDKESKDKKSFREQVKNISEQNSLIPTKVY